ncbi:hypothetical protein KDW82_08960 [Burkholderia vietnamiensis]|uniref:TAXI family TRAP transporter solute-binding subunit n=1 Tax=Burkholderia vietnamiensis TaxID=60552 RepID=UPI001BA0A8E5|nr:TAXI family TRAP transporter solute-binding subunit [Burkholderia vietnamiensis]MBR8189190.1 hypothetical protein [Burkholderia vietnamiensis]HDR9174397.1 hypothetical protein [Burkholderia vietnamiensis]
MKLHIKLAAILAIAITSGAAHAQALTVATGDPAGTYSRMFKELNARCGQSIALTEQSSKGSMDNIDSIEGNQVNGAFVQTDVLVWRAQNEDLSGVKTLVALAPEEIHVIARADGKTEGGIFGIGAKRRMFNSVVDLAGQKVGAVGGSIISAKVIALKANIPYTVVEFPDNKTALNALQHGDIDGVVAVGGSPLKVVSDLDASYKLLSFPKNVLENVNILKVYRPTKVSYPRMNAVGIPTLSTDALFVTRDYKTPQYAKGLVSLRQCLYAHLQELRETTGTHPKWQLVSADNRGKWGWYAPDVK